MPSDVTAPDSFLTRNRALLLAAILLFVELAVIGLTFKHGIDFYCLDNWPSRACGGASGVLVAVYTVMAAAVLYYTLRPAPLNDLVARAGHSLTPLALNFAGLIISMLPVTFLVEGSGTSTLIPAFASWSIGFSLLMAGILLFIAPLGRWFDLVRKEGFPLAGVVVAGLAAPWLAVQIRPVWQLETIADITFRAVAYLVQSFGYDVYVDTVNKDIGTEGFAINVAPVCSGIEGIALVTVFVTLFITLFRKELRFPRVLWLYPAGILVSASLNIVRITVLLIIGLEGNEELAVGGFHSHAGWLMFTLVALGVVLAARSIPALQTAPVVTAGGSAVAPQAELPSVWRDPMAARIVPFAVFMFSAMLAQAFSQSPGLIYPLRALAMAAGLVIFWQVYVQMPRRPSQLSLLAGAAIGLMWVLVPYNPEDTSPAHGGLVGWMLVGWLIARGIGTSILVPIIEELFFRDYLEGKLLKVGGPIVAALITAGLFAILHDRWAEAFVAGLVFSWVMAQRRQVIDAIAAHAVANAIVYAVALATGKMHII